MNAPVNVSLGDGGSGIAWPIVIGAGLAVLILLGGVTGLVVTRESRGQKAQAA